MSEQLDLFEPARSIWVQEVWVAIDSEQRCEVMEILAQMGRASLQQEGPARTRSKEENRDER